MQSLIENFQIGKTTVMAGIKLEVMKPSDDSPEEGMLTIQVEMTPMCNPDTRPGRYHEISQGASSRNRKLILQKKHVWHGLVYVHIITVLNLICRTCPREGSCTLAAA